MEDDIGYAEIHHALEKAVASAEALIRLRDKAASRGRPFTALLYHAKAVGATVTAASLAILLDSAKDIEEVE
jgi:hypothetical protein